MDVKNRKLLYHLTHIDNLDNILENGLLSRNDVLKRGLLRKDVANSDIIDKRQINHLDEFVLFHFYPNTAFDNAVRYTYGAENFIYITYWRDKARNNGFKIVPRHPLNGEFQICEYDKGFELIDWDVFNRPMSDFLDEETRNYAKEVKMAECLSDKIPIFINDIAFIYCNENKVDELKNKFPSISDKIQKGVWLNGN